MPTTAIETATDALLQVIVKGEHERRTAVSVERINGTPFEWQEPAAILLRSTLNLTCLATNLIGRSRQVELARFGYGIHAIGGVDALDEAMFRIAELDPMHSDWRTIVLEGAWGEIGREAA